MINLFIDKIPIIKGNINTITNYILEKIKNDLKEIKSGNDPDATYANFVHKEMAIIGNIINNFNNGEIETKICEFIVYFIKNDGNAEFIEKIISIIVNYSKKENKSNLTKQMLNDCDQILYGYYKSSYYIDFQSFKLLNYLIVNNPKESEKIILLIKNIVFDSLQKIEDNFYGQENIIYTLLLIICWLIKQEGENIKNNIHEEINKITDNIISLVYNKFAKIIENEKTEKNNDNNFLKYFYIVIIFSSFIFYSNFTFSIIFDKNFFYTLLKQTNELMIINNILFSLKINKLLIFGLSKILYENNFLKMILAYFKDGYILNYNLISKQLVEEVKESKNKDKIELSNEEEKENNINNNNDYLVNKINDIIHKELILPLLNFDEFEIFNQLYKKLIEIDETKILINEFLNEMNEESKKDFKNILLTKKMNNGHRRFVKIRKSSI